MKSIPRNSSLSFLIVLVASFPAAPAAGQDAAFAGWDALDDENYTFDPDSSEVATFAISVSGEVRFRFHNANELMKVGNFRLAAEPLQDIINMFPNHLHQVSDTRWVGAAEYAKYLLSTFPPEARREYADWASLRVVSTFERAMRDRDVAVLEGLANRWVVTPQGQQALRRLGDLAHERGAHALAERYHRRRLAFSEPPTPEDPWIALRAAMAGAYAGDAEGARALVRRYATETVKFEGKALPLSGAYERVAASAPRHREDWSVFGGRNDHRGIAPYRGGDVRLTENWHVPAFTGAGRNPFRTRVANYQEFPFHVAVDDGTIVATDGLSVRAFSFFSPEPRWMYEGPLYNVRTSDDFYVFEDYVRPSNGNPPQGSLARSLPLAATVAGGVVVAPLMDLKARGRNIRFDKTPITIAIPKRSLYAIDLDTGEALWTQRRPEQDETSFVNRLSVSVPPIVVGDRVIAAGYILEGAINHHVACFSLKDGRLLWKTPIVVGQQELTMFNKPFKEFTLQMPAEADGSVYVSTNLGLFAALDTLTGHPRWVVQYESIPIKGALHYTQHRERGTSSNNDPPIVADGVVVFSPFDSYSFYAVEASSGKRLWSMKSSSRQGESRYSWLLGVEDGVLVLGGYYGIGLFDLKTGARLGEYPFSGNNADPRGRGCLTNGVVHQPLYDRLLTLRWKRVSPAVVDFDEEFVSWDPDQAGNLLLYRDVKVSMSQDEMTVFYDVDTLVRETRLRVASDDPSLEDLILLGDLEHLRNDHAAAVAMFRRALSHPDRNPESDRRVRDGLFRAYRDLAKLADISGDADSRLEHLKEMAEFARGDHAFLRTVEQVLDIHEAARDFDAYLAALDWIDERAADADYGFKKHSYGGLVRTGLFTLDQRASVAVARSAPVDAVAAWQRMLDRYADLTFAGSSVTRYARERIEEMITQHGRSVYERFEDEARDLHTAAVAGRDRAALLAVIRRFPNSTHSIDYRLDLARLELDSGSPSAVFEVVAPLLSGTIDLEQRVRALGIVARGAEAAGDTQLAATVWRRLVGLGKDVPYSGGEGDSYGSIAKVEAARLTGGGAAAPSGPRLRRRPVLDDVRTRGFELRDVGIVPIVETGASDDPEIVIVFGVSKDDDRAWLCCIDAGDLKERWRAEVANYRHESDPILAYLIGGRLVVRQSRTLRGFDPDDGTLLYERELSALPTFECRGSGLLYLAWDRRDGRNVVAGFEAASGSRFWEREFDRVISDVVVGGDLVLVNSPDGHVVALDGLTGATTYEISLLEFSNRPGVVPFAEFGVLIAAGIEEATNRGRLVGFDLADGRRLWELGDLSFRLAPEWVRAGRESLALLVGTRSSAGQVTGIHTVQLIDPRSGATVREIDTPGRLSTFELGPACASNRLVMIEEDRSRSARKPPRIVVVDLASGEIDDVRLDSLPERRVEVRAILVGDGTLCGTIDVSPVMPRSSTSFAFTLDPTAASLEMKLIPSERERYGATATTTRTSLAVLKADQLYVYRSNRSKEEAR